MFQIRQIYSTYLKTLNATWVSRIPRKSHCGPSNYVFGEYKSAFIRDAVSADTEEKNIFRNIYIYYMAAYYLPLS